MSYYLSIVLSFFIAFLLICIFSIVATFIIHISFLVITSVFYGVFRNNKKLTKTLNEAIYFYAKELGIKNKPVIRLSVIWPDTRYWGLVLGYAGLAVHGGYLVCLYKNRSTKTILQVLAHEMIHVKQYNSGDLSLKNGKKIWKGVDHTHTPYDEQPWEVEAFGGDKALLDKFLNKS